MIAAAIGLLTGGSSPRHWLPWVPACALLLSTGWLTGKLWYERAETSRLAGELADALVREGVLREAVVLQNARITEEQAAAETDHPILDSLYLSNAWWIHCLCRIVA